MPTPEWLAEQAVGSGKIVEIDILADPERLDRLDLSAIDN
jgi:hypothetical protein